MFTLPMEHKDRPMRTVAAMVALSIMLHGAMTLFLSRPPCVSAPAVDVNSFTLIEEPARPPTSSPLPQVNNGGEKLPQPQIGQGKIDAGRYVIDPPKSGNLVIGGPQQSITEIVSQPEVQPGYFGRPGVVPPEPEIVPLPRVGVKPQVLALPTPQYPEMVRDAGIEGRTVVEALVGADGTVGEARVLQSSGNAALDTAAVSAALKARFTPARQGNRVVRVWMSIPYVFRLE